MNDKVLLLADSARVHELILRCVSSVFVALVHSGCEMNCCAELREM